MQTVHHITYAYFTHTHIHTIPIHIHPTWSPNERAARGVSIQTNYVNDLCVPIIWCDVNSLPLRAATYFRICRAGCWCDVVEPPGSSRACLSRASTIHQDQHATPRLNLAAAHSPLHSTSQSVASSCWLVLKVTSSSAEREFGVIRSTVIVSFRILHLFINNLHSSPVYIHGFFCTRTSVCRFLYSIYCKWSSTLALVAKWMSQKRRFAKHK